MDEMRDARRSDERAEILARDPRGGRSGSGRGRRPTLEADAEEARRRLAADAEALGAAAADRILGRKAS